MTFAFAVMHIGGAGYFSPPRVLTNPGRRVSADISSTSSLTRGSMDCAAVRAVAAVSSIQHSRSVFIVFIFRMSCRKRNAWSLSCMNKDMYFFRCIFAA